MKNIIFVLLMLGVAGVQHRMTAEHNPISSEQESRRNIATNWMHAQGKLDALKDLPTTMQIIGKQKFDKSDSNFDFFMNEDVYGESLEDTKRVVSGKTDNEYRKMIYLQMVFQNNDDDFIEETGKLNDKELSQKLQSIDLRQKRELAMVQYVYEHRVTMLGKIDQEVARKVKYEENLSEEEKVIAENNKYIQRTVNLVDALTEYGGSYNIDEFGFAGKLNKKIENKETIEWKASYNELVEGALHYRVCGMLRHMSDAEKMAKINLMYDPDLDILGEIRKKIQEADISNVTFYPAIEYKALTGSKEASGAEQLSAMCAENNSETYYTCDEKMMMTEATKVAEKLDAKVKSNESFAEQADSIKGVLAQVVLVGKARYHVTEAASYEAGFFDQTLRSAINDSTRYLKGGWDKDNIVMVNFRKELKETIERFSTNKWDALLPDGRKFHKMVVKMQDIVNGKEVSDKEGLKQEFAAWNKGNLELIRDEVLGTIRALETADEEEIKNVRGEAISARQSLFS